MFEEFLYLLWRNGLNVSLTEWMALMEGLDKGLHGASFTGFYQLCRCLLVKSEADFDRFDRCFLEYFKDVPFQQEVSQELLNWLDKPDVLTDYANWDELQALKNLGLSEEEIERMLQERMAEQTEEHNGGNYWVGTHGMSVFGNSGLSPRGIRVGGQSMYRRAFRVAGERKFRDFRRDNTLDTRQFQVALRHLRQFSGLVGLPPTEFDVDRTIQDTAGNGGVLKVRYRRPRENTVKVLLLMDSGGSMDYYASLCSALFQAVSKSGHFKDLKVYYFHNCVYTRLYQSPALLSRDAVSTDWVLSNLPGDYKAILVGDAQMAPYELMGGYYGRSERPDGPRCGMDWLRLLRSRYRNAIWLNPSPRPDWGEYWSQTYDAIAREFPMFPLTVDGLEEGMKKLLVR
ncbi:MAG: VWA domain-containing protein [Lawsonibacter sp.]|nr:VWA domain-containing protein [Lawsonibacter sp.]